MYFSVFMFFSIIGASSGRVGESGRISSHIFHQVPANGGLRLSMTKSLEIGGPGSAIYVPVWYYTTLLCKLRRECQLFRD